MDSIGCLILDGIEYKVDSWVLKLWEIWVETKTSRFEHNAHYLEQFKVFCRNILDIFKDSK